MGIEPTTSAWKAEVLPVNYTRIMSIQKNIKINTSTIITGYPLVVNNYYLKRVE
jgi:hypothetical protein